MVLTSRCILLKLSFSRFKEFDVFGQFSLAQRPELNIIHTDATGYAVENRGDMSFPPLSCGVPDRVGQIIGYLALVTQN
jgi:hypothetical protein